MNILELVQPVGVEARVFSRGGGWGDFKLLKQQKCMELTVRVMLCIGDRAGSGEGETHGRAGGN